MSTWPTMEPPLTTCPGWCVEERHRPATEVLQPEIVHMRPLAAGGGMHIALEWTEDVTPLDHPGHYYEPPALVVYDGAAPLHPLFLPATPEVLDALQLGAARARVLLEQEQLSRWATTTEGEQQR